MSIKWFGVKVLVRTNAVGRPRARDSYLDAEGALVEERIVVVRASTAKRASEKARRIAMKDARLRYQNIYGQEVRQRVLKAWESYELFDPPSEGAEVFSDTHRVPKAMTDERIAARFLSPEIGLAEQRRRATFIAAGLIAAFTPPANKALQRTGRRPARR